MIRLAFYIVLISFCPLLSNCCSFLGYQAGKYYENDENHYDIIDTVHFQKDSSYIVVFNDNSKVKGFFKGYTDSAGIVLAVILKENKKQGTYQVQDHTFLISTIKEVRVVKMYPHARVIGLCLGILTDVGIVFALFFYAFAHSSVYPSSGGAW